MLLMCVAASPGARGKLPPDRACAPQRALSEGIGMADPSTSIFERTSLLARELGAINLGQGFPDLPEPAELLEAAQRALVARSNQYPPMRGLPELRQAVCDYYRREQGLELEPEQVVVTAGATDAARSGERRV